MTNNSSDQEDSEYSQVANDEQVEAMIQRCFEQICEEDERKFVKKFREQSHDESQITHTFRELVLGAYLSSRGFKVRYDCVVDAKTPDWCILDENLIVCGIVELTSFHIDEATDDEIEKQLRAKGRAWFWRDKNKDNIDRLYHSIWDKAQVYKALLQECEVPYVVAVFGEFKVAIDFDEELCPCLLDEEVGLFRLYPEVSGALYFESGPGGFLFNYIHNPNALRKISLPSGVF